MIFKKDIKFLKFTLVEAIALEPNKDKPIQFLLLAPGIIPFMISKSQQTFDFFLLLFGWFIFILYFIIKRFERLLQKGF